jgi:hypothetical protein
MAAFAVAKKPFRHELWANGFHYISPNRGDSVEVRIAAPSNLVVNVN